MTANVSLRTPVPTPLAAGASAAAQPQTPVKIGVSHLNFFYGAKQALIDISMEMRDNVVTAFIGPSGCGKSTFLRTLNRMNDIVAGARCEGSITIDGKDIYGGTDVVGLRRKVGMVFQKSNPFPKSIYENVAYGLRINGMARGRRNMDEQVESSLSGGTGRGEGSPARLGARPVRRTAAALHCTRPRHQARSPVDGRTGLGARPIATQRIEELIHELKKDYTIVIVTHNMQQAAGCRIRRRFSGWASSSNSVRPNGCSPIRPKS